MSRSLRRPWSGEGVGGGGPTSAGRMDVVLLHGVGMWPGLLARPCADLPLPCSAPPRPGYAGLAAATDFAAQVDAVSSALARESGPDGTVLVGVSGGATLALAAGLADPPWLRGILTHEPLVGPLVPHLHRRILAAVAGFRERGVDHVDPFLTALYGDGWSDGLPDSQLWVERHRATIVDEVGQFASFEPSLDALAAIGIPHVTSVGERSSDERFRVASLLARCGARVRVIPDAGHLVPVENPQAFAASVVAFIAEVEG